MTDFTVIEREDAQRRARLTSPTALRDAAIWYGTVAGWPIFPLITGGKVPATKNGFKDATTDRAAIDRWWKANPSYNIGVPTGAAFDVIDIDGPPGFTSLADLRHADCPTDCCATTTCRPDRSHILGMSILAVAYTGGGGRHLLIEPTGQRNGAKLLPGIDYRGNGGYIVLPPSVHESGRHYEWLEPPTASLMAAAA